MPHGPIRWVLKSEMCTQKRHPTFGMIYAPRTREEKRRHLTILDSIPLEVVPAVEERKALRSGHVNKLSDPIAHILMKHDATPESHLINTLCKACAGRNFEPTIWNTIFETSSELVPTISSVDASIILKCFMLFENASGRSVESELVRSLFGAISRRHENGQMGFYTILYGLQGLNHFGCRLDSRTNKRILTHLLRSIRLSTGPLPVLISMIQALSARLPLPVVTVVEPILFEAASRFSASPDISDVDAVFGLVSAASKFVNSESVRSILKTAESHFTGDTDLISACSIEQLSGLAHVYSRMGPAVLSGYVNLLTRLGNELARCDAWTPRILAVTINAFSTSAVLHGDLIERLLGVAPQIADKLDPTQTSMSIYGLSRLGNLKQFPSIIERANILVNEFDLHSLCKLVSVFGESNIATSDVFSDRLVEKINGQARWDSDSIEGLVLLTHSLAKRPFDRRIEPVIFKVLSENISVLTWCKIAPLMLAMATRQSPEVSNFCGAAMKRLRDENPDITSLTLADATKILHAISINLTLERSDVEVVSRQIRARASQIPSLTFRPLNRLASAMIRCGVFDEDVREAIQDRLDALNGR